MPWQRPEDDPPNSFPTLGYQVADWIEERCAIPDREMVGDPFLLTDEQLRFLLHLYRLDPDTGEFFYARGAQLTRPQKWGKGPIAAAVICAEAQGPVRFDRWDPDHRDGVVGKQVATPLIQVTAVSEDQAENVYTALLQRMASSQRVIAPFHGFRSAHRLRTRARGRPAGRPREQ